MTQDDILKVIAAIGVALYLSWLMIDAMRTGVFQSPGAGRSVDRDEDPGIFALTIVVAAIAILVAGIVVVTTIAHAIDR